MRACSKWHVVLMGTNTARRVREDRYRLLNSIDSAQAGKEASIVCFCCKKDVCNLGHAGRTLRSGSDDKLTISVGARFARAYCMCTVNGADSLFVMLGFPTASTKNSYCPGGSEAARNPQLCFSRETSASSASRSPSLDEYTTK